MLSADPARQVFAHHIDHHVDMRRVVVEAGDIGEALAARVLEARANFFVDLFERLGVGFGRVGVSGCIRGGGGVEPGDAGLPRRR